MSVPDTQQRGVRLYAAFFQLETRSISIQLALDRAIGWITRGTPNNVLLNVAVDGSNCEAHNHERHRGLPA
jgi:hypothetical protein